MSKKVIVLETLYEYIGEIEERLLDDREMPKTPFVLKNVYRMQVTMGAQGPALILIGPYEGIRIRNYMMCRRPTQNEYLGYEKNREADSPIKKASALPPGLPPPEKTAKSPLVVPGG